MSWYLMTQSISVAMASRFPACMESRVRSHSSRTRLLTGSAPLRPVKPCALVRYSRWISSALIWVPFASRIRRRPVMSWLTSRIARIGLSSVRSGIVVAAPIMPSTSPVDPALRSMVVSLMFGSPAVTCSRRNLPAPACGSSRVWMIGRDLAAVGAALSRMGPARWLRQYTAPGRRRQDGRTPAAGDGERGRAWRCRLLMQATMLSGWSRMAARGGRLRCGPAGRQRREVAWVRAAGVEPERRVFVSHQRDVGQDAVAPAVQAHDQVEDPLRVAAGDRQDDRGDHREQGDQADAAGDPPRRAPAELPAPGEDRHDQVLRQREQPPLHQHQAPAEPLRVIHAEVGRVGRVRLQAERRVLIGAQSADAVEGDPPGPAHYPDVEIKDRPGIAAVNKIANPATTVSTLTAHHRKNSTTKCGITSSHLTSHSHRLVVGSSCPSRRAG